ncbi:ROK family protein [Salipiger sp. IMCC34102]|uniref:ROK family protein n=1 Tax=Salipiger sp. IMCC34102 TaxID=2510647 RepID=UPI00101BFA27|nr:ROK family protein [Salipiger sp. IMCC34102]RYH04495.1 ROK family protein [Salipiger sp. IMCC34102]
MILCCDIGGTAIKLAEARSPDDLVLKARIPTPTQDFDAFVKVLRDAIAAASAPPAAIAFSLAGVVEPGTGVATMANIPCLTGRRLEDDLTAALGLPVILANDADCFALAEAELGAGRGHEVVFGLILGTGVGGGVVVRGQLVNGAGFAGEIGHGPVAARILDDLGVTLPAIPCGCGLTGCLDVVCSARGMERLHLHLHGRAADSREIVAGWQAGEPDAGLTIAAWLEVLSGPLAMVENVLGAGIIAVGGGLSTAPDLIAALDVAVRAKILRRFDRPLVVPAQCIVEPGLIGAAILGLSLASR